MAKPRPMCHSSAVSDRRIPNSDIVEAAWSSYPAVGKTHAAALSPRRSVTMKTLPERGNIGIVARESGAAIGIGGAGTDGMEV
jgi:hypothetical protein